MGTQTNTAQVIDPFRITEPTLISFSGGRTSAYMLWRVLQTHNGILPNDAVVCFANTGKEVEQTYEFIKNCEAHWNVKINWLEYLPDAPGFKVVNFGTAARNGEPFEAVIRKYSKLPNPAQRWCTGKLKITTMHKFVRSLGWEHHESDNNDFVGIRYDEPRRSAKSPLAKMPLVAAKITKADIFEFWSKQPFDLNLPVINGETVGGNCDLCFLKSLPKVVSLIREKPELATWWIKMEALIPTVADVKKLGSGNRFRLDRPSYQDLLNNNHNQKELFDDGDIACFCGD